MPKISVCIPTYNREQFLPEAIDSVLNQTFGDFELIISDDGSSDRSDEIIKNYLQKDSRIKYFKNETNLGAYANFNRCITYASCDYITLFNSDDVMLPRNLEVKVDILDTYPTVGLVASSASIIDENGRDMNESWAEEYQYPVDMLCPGKEWIWESAGKTWTIHTSFVVFRKQSSEKVGSFFKCTSPPLYDFEMWLRIATVSYIYVAKENLGKFRLHQNNLVSQYNHLQRIKNLAEIWHQTIEELNLSGLELTAFEHQVISQMSEVCTDLALYHIREGKLKYALQLYDAIANWRNTYVNLIPSVTILGKEIIELRSWIVQLQSGKDWLETQRKQTQIELARSQAGNQELQTGKDWLESQWKQTQIELARSQAGNQELQTGKDWLESQWKQTQIELARSQAGNQELQTGKDWLESQWKQTQIELARSQAGNQELQTGKDWLESQYRAWMQTVEQTQAELERVQATVKAMESSKFWKIRNVWLRLKRVFGLME